MRRSVAGYGPSRRNGRQGTTSREAMPNRICPVPACGVHMLRIERGARGATRNKDRFTARNSGPPPVKMSAADVPDAGARAGKRKAHKPHGKHHARWAAPGY